MSAIGLTRLDRAGLARRASCVLLASSGCLSQSYQISAPELQRIAQLPTEERGERVRVTQQTSFGDEVGDVESEPFAYHAFALGDCCHTDHGHHRGHRRRGRSHDVDRDADGDGAAEEALATVVVVAAAAASAAVTVGITEGARFDGWMQAHAAHPVLLVHDRGRRQWTRLDRLTPEDLHDVDHAVLPDFGDDLQRLERHPLDRAGFVYQLEFGAEPAPFEGPSFAVSGRAGLGFMPAQRYGFLLGAAFSTARSDEPSNARERSTLSVDYRTFLQIEAWPVSGGRWHLGPYAELGYAWALADTAFGSRGAQGPMLALGGALQLDWTTRLAVTLRAGAAWVPSVDMESQLPSAHHRLAPALTLGISIY